MRKRDQIFFISFSIGIVVLVLFIFIVFRQPPPEAPYGYKSYINKKEGYSLIYPDDWARVPNKGMPPSGGQQLSAMFIKPEAKYNPKDPKLKPTINIVVDDLSMAPSNLDKYTETAIHQIRAVFKDYLNILESSPSELSGMPAHKIIYTINMQERGIMKLMQVWTINNKKGYQFTYAASLDDFDIYLSKIEEGLKDFKLFKNRE